MTIRLKRAVSAASVFFIIFTAQMPEWKPFIDREDNIYFLDGAGRIYVNVDSETRLKAVSAKSIDYNLHLADEMIRRHRKADALTIWKSILCLEPDNMRIIEARQKASGKLNALMRSEGTRYPALDREASSLFIRDGETVRFLNDFIRFSLEFRGNVVPVRRNIRAGIDSYYHGITVGVRIDGEDTDNKGPFDYLAAFDSHIFKTEIEDIETFRRYRGAMDPRAVTQRELILSGDDLLIYEISGRWGQEYSGFELYGISGKKGTMARFITPVNRFAENRDEMLQAAESFRKTAVTRFYGL